MQQKRIIIAIIGPSGSGKTELMKYLNDVYGIPFISSFTTRPSRDSERNGVEHIFVSDEEYFLNDKDDILAECEFGGYRYWATKSQVWSTIPTTYVVDEASYLKMKEEHSDEFNFFCVYIDRKNPTIDQERIDRDKGRMTMPSCEIDVAIENNGDNLNEFLTGAAATIAYKVGEKFGLSEYRGLRQKSLERLLDLFVNRAVITESPYKLYAVCTTTDPYILQIRKIAEIEMVKKLDGGYSMPENFKDTVIDEVTRLKEEELVHVVKLADWESDSLQRYYTEG